MESQLREYEKAREVLESRIKYLFDSAFAVVEVHWEVVKAEERKRPGWENKSRLQVRVKQIGNSIRADWSAVKWLGKGEARKAKYTHISKPRGEFAYTLSKLQAHAQPWEVGLIKDTEEKLAQIRREASHVVKALLAVRNAMQAAKARG